MTEVFDVAIVGLGAMGGAAAAHLAARGARVVGFDASHPAHPLSSSHGDSRVIRLGYFEDPAYVPLLRRAYRNWRALEARVHEELLTITGVLHVGAADSDIVRGTRAACEQYDLPFEMLDAGSMRLRYPMFALGAGEVGLLEPEGGFLRPERVVAAHLRVAALAGAVLRLGEKVTGIEPGDRGVTVVSPMGRVRARTVIVATGPWIAELVPDLRPVAVPIRQVVAWYAARDAIATAPGRMPVYLRDEGEAGSYFGFPALGGEGLKVGRHCHFHEPLDPDEPNAPVNDRDKALLDGFMARNLPEAAGARLAATTCRYTMLPGEHFLIDRLPSEASIIVASPCSGHGFKFASVIGEILADLASRGGTDLPVDLFSFLALQARIAAGQAA